MHYSHRKLKFQREISIQRNARNESSDVKFELRRTSHERRPCTSLNSFFVALSFSRLRVYLSPFSPLFFAFFFDPVLAWGSFEKEKGNTGKFSDEFFCFRDIQFVTGQYREEVQQRRAVCSAVQCSVHSPIHDIILYDNTYIIKHTHPWIFAKEEDQGKVHGKKRQQRKTMGDGNIPDERIW